MLARSSKSRPLTSCGNSFPCPALTPIFYRIAFHSPCRIRLTHVIASSYCAGFGCLAASPSFCLLLCPDVFPLLARCLPCSRSPPPPRPTPPDPNRHPDVPRDARRPQPLRHPPHSPLRRPRRSPRSLLPHALHPFSRPLVCRATHSSGPSALHSPSAENVRFPDLLPQPFLARPRFRHPSRFLRRNRLDRLRLPQNVPANSRLCAPPFSSASSGAAGTSPSSTSSVPPFPTAATGCISSSPSPPP